MMKEEKPRCDYCGGALPPLGFYQTCHVCEATYCYSHFAKHTAHKLEAILA